MKTTLKFKSTDNPWWEAPTAAEQLAFAQALAEAMLDNTSQSPDFGRESAGTAKLRGPTLIEDLILREEITHFDHERLPERLSHSQGLAAQGYFEVNQTATEFTRTLGAVV